MNKQQDMPQFNRGGGVQISPNIKKESVVLTKDGKVIPVKDDKEMKEVIRQNLGK